MSKRKATIGGYEVSSDDSERESASIELSIKKVKAAPLALPGRWISSSEKRSLPPTRPPPFSRTPSLSSQVGSLSTTAASAGVSRSTSVQIGPLRGVASASAAITANVLAPEDPQRSILLEGDILDYEQEASHSQHLNDSNGKKPALRVRTDGLLTQFEKPRSTIMMERQLNETRMKLEECQQMWEEKHQETQDKLTKLLQA
ncbi:hypothetical protein V565_160750, partial [Rhizoctonia solani 123E]